MTPKELRELAGHLLEIHDSQTHEEQEELDLADAVSVLREYADLKESAEKGVPPEAGALKGDKP
jgi:hypothetical protein